MIIKIFELLQIANYILLSAFSSDRWLNMVMIR